MQLLGAPTIEFCEKAGTGPIKRPFYALSNFAYLFIGLIILKKGQGSRLSKQFGYLSILIGFFSFIYDASYTYFSQLIDLLGMLLFVNLLIYLSAKRFFLFSGRKIIFFQFWAICFGILTIIYFKSMAGEFVFGLFIIFAIILEFLLWRKKKALNFSLWLQGVGVFILGFLFWLPDALGLFCDPNNYINGRSIFHLLTALTIYLLYQYYSLQNSHE